MSTCTTSGTGKAYVFSKPKCIDGESLGTLRTGTFGALAKPFLMVLGLEPHTVSTQAGDSGSPLLVQVAGQWKICGTHLCDPLASVQVPRGHASYRRELLQHCGRNKQP